MKTQKKAAKLNLRRETVADLTQVSGGALPPTTSIQPTCYSVRPPCFTDTCHTCINDCFYNG
jgi:hypothetical protein